jgi:hypothetical protein
MGVTMKSHECQGNLPRVWRLVLALIEWDESAYRLTMGEIRDCTDCLADALSIVLPMLGGRCVLDSGGRDKAADVVAEEIERMLS